MKGQSDDQNPKQNEQQTTKKPGDDPLIGEILFGQYTVREPIGKGSFGKIYKCVTDDEKEFAAKIVICLYII